MPISFAVLVECNMKQMSIGTSHAIIDIKTNKTRERANYQSCWFSLLPNKKRHKAFHHKTKTRTQTHTPTRYCVQKQLATAKTQGGYSHFFFIRRLGPSIYCSPQQKYQEFQTPPKIFEILATQKNIPVPTLTLRKDHKMHRNDL